MARNAEGSLLAEDLFSTPVQAERISDVIAERIALAIRDRRLQPGDRLPTEHELARQLGVGRTSVREGLQRLRALGLIEVRKGLGAYVANEQLTETVAQFLRWTATHGVAIEELLEARIALETIASALAAVHADPGQIDVLRTQHRAHAAAAKTKDVESLAATDHAFHATILAATRNQFIMRMYSALVSELADFRRQTLALPWAPSRSVKGHAAVLAAIEKHDPAAARAAMLDHLSVLYTEVTQSVTTGAAPQSRLAPLEVFG